MRQALIRWAVANGRVGTSVLYFDEITEPESTLGTRIADAILHQSALFHTTTVATVERFGKLIDVATGQYMGDWGVPGATTPVVGTQAGTNVPNATQGLLRYTSAAIVNGRRLKGRTFVPGLAIAGDAGGEVNPTTRTGLLAMANEWRTAGLLIWHRPKRDRESGEVTEPGQAVAPSGASVWNEYAVLRRRR